jgi:hypothetical protein
MHVEVQARGAGGELEEPHVLPCADARHTAGPPEECLVETRVLKRRCFEAGRPPGFAVLAEENETGAVQIELELHARENTRSAACSHDLGDGACALCPLGQ